MIPSTIAAFWAVSVLLVLVPGADWAYVIGAALRDRSVVPAVSGLLLGYVALTAVVAAGVAALVAQTPDVLTALTIAGSIYLIWLGGTTLARPAAPRAAAEPQGRGSALARIGKGAGISGLNPKALLLFLALLPQFTQKNHPLAAQIGTLGVVHILNCAAVYLTVGALARQLLKTRPAAARVVTRFSGTAMILIGILLLIERAF